MYSTSLIFWVWCLIMFRGHDGDKIGGRGREKFNSIAFAHSPYPKTVVSERLGSSSVVTLSVQLRPGSIWPVTDCSTMRVNCADWWKFWTLIGSSSCPKADPAHVQHIHHCCFCPRPTLPSPLLVVLVLSCSVLFLSFFPILFCPLLVVFFSVLFFVLSSPYLVLFLSHPFLVLSIPSSLSFLVHFFVLFYPSSILSWLVCLFCLFLVLSSLFHLPVCPFYFLVLSFFCLSSFVQLYPCCVQSLYCPWYCIVFLLFLNFACV